MMALLMVLLMVLLVVLLMVLLMALLMVLGGPPPPANTPRLTLGEAFPFNNVVQQLQLQQQQRAGLDVEGGGVWAPITNS
jgi:hypothetical protein